jgi:hypothetical protein
MRPITNESAAVDNATSDSAAAPIGPLSWNEAVWILLAAHLCGTPAGRKEAASHIVRMAQVADLAQDAASLLSQLPELARAPSADEWIRQRDTVLLRAKALGTKAPAPAPDEAQQTSPAQRRLGALAQRCGRELELDIYYSGAGFYLGTYSEDGPYTRESREYWRTREQAQRALETGQWTQRKHL